MNEKLEAVRRLKFLCVPCIGGQLKENQNGTFWTTEQPQSNRRPDRPASRVLLHLPLSKTLRTIKHSHFTPGGEVLDASGEFVLMGRAPADFSSACP